MPDSLRRPSFLRSAVGPSPQGVDPAPHVASLETTEHWFDAWTKRLASGGLSRRGWFSLGLRTGAAAVASSLFSSLPFIAFAQTAAPNTCVRRASGASTLDEIAVEQGGLTLQQQRSFSNAGGSATARLTVSRAQTLVVDVQAQSGRNGAGSATITYGEGVQGVHTATVNTADGRSFEGTIDGRAFTAIGIPSSMNAVRFADGNQPPQITTDASINGAVKALWNQARALLASCRSSGVSTPRTPFRADAAPMISRGGAVATCDADCRSCNQGGWYEPQGAYAGNLGPSCDDCGNNCVNTANKYSGVTDWETYTNPVSFAYAMIAYNAIYAVCWTGCHVPGGGCCPVSCGYPNCCGSGAVCFNGGGNLCCPSPSIVCNNVCCAAGVTSCAADGFCGCPPTMNQCGNECCTSLQACCGGKCCAPGATQCCGDSCCPAGTGSCCGNICCPTGSSVCCGKNLCCPNGSSCCGGQCCPGGAPCINNVCCASPSTVCGKTCCPPFSKCVNGTCCATVVCGNVCCPAGQTCVDPRSGTCSSSTCPPGTSLCRGAGEKNHCCPPNTACCFSQCCPPGQTCCGPGRLCVPNGQCIS
jgi:hypothetical protein